MLNVIDRIFNVYVLLAFNAAIILFGEFGGGEFLFHTGAIHAIAVLFVILSVMRVAYHYYSYDQFLEKFFHYYMVAMLVFALSHAVEFVSYVVLKLRHDASSANVANLYIVSIFIIALGAESFLLLLGQGSRKIAWLLRALIALFVALTALFIFNDKLVSLDLEDITPYAYLAVVFIAGGFAMFRIRSIGRKTPLAVATSRYFFAGIIFVALSVLPNIFYDIGELAGIPNYRIVNISHYLFYLALSAMFLSFRGMASIASRGIYAAIEKSAHHNNVYDANEL